jgi:hypothetical protein
MPLSISNHQCQWLKVAEFLVAMSSKVYSILAIGEMKEKMESVRGKVEQLAGEGLVSQEHNIIELP